MLSVLTYFAGVLRTEKRLKHEDRDNRINTVLNKYLDFRRSNITGGLDGLQKAGIANLNDDKEIEDLINIIIGHAERDPLGGHREIMQGKSLKKFFNYAAVNRIDFHKVKTGDILQKLDNIVS